jgi:pentapeptide repeat protein
MDKTNGNTGNYNTGNFNSCNFSAGVFCTTEEKIRIFNMPSDMTASEFYDSEYYTALCSAPFRLTEWIYYTEEEKDTEEKRVLGGCLKTYTYEEACANWWEKMREEDRQTVMSMPNFDKDIFFEITGIEV